MRLELDNIQFQFVCAIEPERDESGKIRQFMPQARYANATSKPLNRYGSGQFCKFKIPSSLLSAGVYALTIAGEVRYLGQCENLSQRFGVSGYGSIQPRNCFVGGQATNCKINSLVLKNTALGNKVNLWFHQTDDRKDLESRLIQTVRPDWNGRL